MSIISFNHKTPQLNTDVYVADEATVIGDVSIGKDSSVWPQAVIRGDINRIEIGEGTSIQDGCVVHVTHDGPFNPGGFATTIGNRVTIGHHATLHGCTIHDECLIGIKATVLDGAIIEPNVVLGAGSLVPPGKTLTSGYLWLGSPVKQIRPITDKEKDFFQYSANYYIKLKNQYLKSED